MMISEEDIKRMKKSLKRKEKKREEKEKKPNIFVSISNLFFKNISLKLSQKNFFKKYGEDLRKANISLLLPSYLSLILFLTLISFIFSFLLAITFWLFKPTILSFFRNLLFSLLFSFLVFLFFLIYPKLEIKSIERKIDAELPFAALYMASIASSGVQPVKVFNLLVESKEYREVAKQVEKITNRINFLGMDLVTAIKDSIKIIANNNLRAMLNGLATTIVTGGDIKDYLEEEAKKFLLEYKSAREKFATSIEVYADLYTGLLITAPMMFVIILALSGLFQQQIGGIPITNLAIFGIFILIVLNIVFLIYLNIVTPPS
jgi:flagellar protein FlaJ